MHIYEKHIQAFRMACHSEMQGWITPSRDETPCFQKGERDSIHFALRSVFLDLADALKDKQQLSHDFSRYAGPSDFLKDIVQNALQKNQLDNIAPVLPSDNLKESILSKILKDIETPKAEENGIDFDFVAYGEGSMIGERRAAHEIFPRLLQDYPRYLPARTA